MGGEHTKFDLILMTTLAIAAIILDFGSIIGLVAVAIPIVGIAVFAIFALTSFLFLGVVLVVFLIKRVFAPLLWIINLIGLLSGIVWPTKTITVLTTMFLANHPMFEKAAELAAEAALAVATGGVSAAGEAAIAGAEAGATGTLAAAEVAEGAAATTGEAAVAAGETGVGATETTEGLSERAAERSKTGRNIGEREGAQPQEEGGGETGGQDTEPPEEDLFGEPKEPSEKLKELFEKTPQPKGSSENEEEGSPLYEEDELDDRAA